MKVRTDIMEGVDLRCGREMSSKSIGFNGELIVAKMLRSFGVPCWVTGYHHPLDVIAPGLGIEVKTCTKLRKIHILRPQRRSKREWCQKNFIHGITVVVRPVEVEYIELTGEMIEYSEITYKDGFKSFDITRMNNFEEVLNEFYGKV